MKWTQFCLPFTFVFTFPLFHISLCCIQQYKRRVFMCSLTEMIKKTLLFNGSLFYFPYSSNSFILISSSNYPLIMILNIFWIGFVWLQLPQGGFQATFSSACLGSHFLILSRQHGSQSSLSRGLRTISRRCYEINQAIYSKTDYQIPF